MLSEGLGAMFVGLITVFTFLSILWGVVCSIGKVIELLNKWFPQEVKTAGEVIKSICPDSELAVAIAVAKLRK